MRKLLFLLSFLFTAVMLHAQDAEIAKLQKQLRTNPQTRMQTAVRLRDIFSDMSSDSAYVLGNYLLKQGIEDDNQPLMIYGKLILGGYYNNEGKTEISIRYLTECVNYYTKRGDLEKLADAQNLLGIAYIFDAQYNKAASWLIKSIKTADKLGPDNESYMAQLNLAEVYIRENRLDIAESEVLSFLERTKKQNLKQGTKKGYDYLAKIYMQKGDMPLAITYYEKALELALKNNSKTGKANAYNNIAIAHFETGELDLSLENFKKALQLRIELGEPLGISESYYNLGDWNFYQNKFEEAARFYLMSLDIAEKNNLTKEMADACSMVAESFKARKKYKEAYDYLERHLELVNIMKEKNQVREIDLQRASYEAEREEQRLNQKKREDRMQNRVETEQDRGKIIVIGFSLVVGLLIISYFFLLARNHRNSEENHAEPEQNTGENNARIKESSWNKIEHFLSGFESRAPDFSAFSGKLKFIENVHLLPLSNGNWLFWEAPVSKLENYVLRDYLESQADGSQEKIVQLLQTQKLVDVDELSYGIIGLENGEISISGKNGLLIQGQDKMSFLTENQSTVKTFTVLISEKFKNELVATSQWDKFTEQTEIILKMSSHMAMQTMEECWQEMLGEEKLGMILFFPE